MEDKLRELREKYRNLLREGKTSQATQVARQAKQFKGDYQVDDSDDEEVVESEPEPEEVGDDFTDLKGVGDELAVELREKFGSFDGMRDASPEDLEPIPGIGEKRAKSLLEQLQ